MCRSSMKPKTKASTNSGETFYQVLGVSENARQAEINSAYYRLSNRYHPCERDDMYGGADDSFRKVSEAYQVLADPVSRHKYDKFGEAGLRDHAYIDALTLFTMRFRGGAFESLIGQLELAVVCPEAGNGETNVSHEDWETSQATRLRCLETMLAARLDRYVRGDESGFALESIEEAERLRAEPMGQQLLEAIGYSYLQAAKSELAERFDKPSFCRTVESKQLLGRRDIHACKTGLKAVSSLMLSSATKTALSKRISTLKRAGASEEVIDMDAGVMRLRELLMKRMRIAFLKNSHQDVDLTIRQVVKAVTSDSEQSVDILRRRCEGLVVLGYIFREPRHRIC